MTSLTILLFLGIFLFFGCKVDGKEMAPHYKLYYFESRGLGEVSRQLFALAKVEYENIRIPKDQWPTLKNETPFGQVPVLEVDGVKIPQSLAIARYLARKFGYAGETPEEEALVDAFADQFKDFYVQIHDFYYRAGGFEQGDVEEAKNRALIPARDKFLPLLTKFLRKSNSGFLVDSGLTYADLIIVDNMTSIIGWYPEYLQNYPEIQAWYEKVVNVPAIKSEIENRPKTNA
ncbi:unnamed protein product [Caenorhabditis auriculariae]|uniref:glutathione transferase n=1 Tax=Caenorhabditis auriculariae TaxID=2777116 RepID=A0A8S1HIK9_9PELO|nr:unnamed protein product [Caenorhabditis auriculariae]